VGRLADRFFARFYDRLFAACERDGLTDLRREHLASATGEVLEVGAGTGLNLELYPDTVTRLVLTEPEPAMADQLREKVEGDRRSIEVHVAPGERVPFEDDSFDTVVGTLMLCTAPDPDAVLAEAARVLRPGGRYLFMEHVRAEDGTGTARWQDRLERPWMFLAGGCHPNRRTPETLGSSPLSVTELRQSEMPKPAGPLVRPMILGVAELRG
jgi:ubiquinone/menaquinone biosynthesis C-methylase UbiE